MKKLIIGGRDAFFSWGYRHLLKPLFFLMDPEKIHDRMVRTGRLLGGFAPGRWLIKAMFYSSSPMLSQKVAGLRFDSPVGLAAGFDKNAELSAVLPFLSFGFAEYGSVTGEPCEGNAKPRLWRLKRSQGLLVYYGLKNDGAEVLAKRMGREFPRQRRWKLARHFVNGVSVAKTNCAETVDCTKGVMDYAKAYREVRPYADYITVNISCPNAFGGQPFTDRKSLDLLLKELDQLYQEGRPVFIKMSPDLQVSEIDDILEVCSKHRVDGYVCSNLTKKRENHKIVEKDFPEVGGISGKVVQHLADDLIRHVYLKTGGKKAIIGVGGIFSAEDAYEKIKNGASLVQLITGMIFQGPSLISEINLGLERLLKKDGYKHVSEAVGVNLK